jgi:hypothetical protein
MQARSEDLAGSRHPGKHKRGSVAGVDDTAPCMCCVRLCAVDEGRGRFSLLSAISGDDVQHITDRPDPILRHRRGRDATADQRRERGQVAAPSSPMIPLCDGDSRPDAAIGSDGAAVVARLRYQPLGGHVDVRAGVNYVL